MGQTSKKIKHFSLVVKHRVKRTSSRVIKAVKQVSFATVSRVKKVPQTNTYKVTNHLAKKTARGSIKTTKFAHKHIAKKPHEKLMSKSKRYAWWHSWSYKKITSSHIHGTIAIAWTLLVIFLVSSSVQNASALSTWTQTDWSGGVGTDTSNQYSSASNIDIGTSGQVTLIRSANEFTNSTLNVDMNSWNGSFKTHDSSKGYNALGSAKITVPAAGDNFFSDTKNSPVKQPYLILSEDFNNDGIADIASATGNAEHKVSVALGNNDGTFGSAVDYEGRQGIDAAPAGIVARDFNADGSTDIAVAFGRSYPSVLLNNGDGTFAPYSAYSATYVQGVTSGDYNNDGKIDLVTSSTYSSGVVQVRYGDNSGTFSTYDTHTIGASAGGNKMGTQDLNSDGFDDIVTARGTKVGVMISNGASFNAVAEYTTQISTGIALGDINNDQHPDIMLTGTTATQVLINNGSGGFAPAVSIASLNGINASQIVITDLNYDDWQDIAVVTPSGFAYVINDQAGAFSSPVEVLRNLPYSLTWADQNNDSKDDIIVGSASAQNFTTFFNGYGGNTFVQKVDLGDTSDYRLEANAYIDGSAVTSSDVELFSDGKPLTTTITPTQKAGWYKLSAKNEGHVGETGYGIQVKQGKTVYIDDLDLFKYADSGTLTSAIYDLGFGGDWGTLTYTTNNPANTQVKVRTSNNSDMSGAPAFAGCPIIASGTDLTGQTCVNNNDRYVQYEVTLSKFDGNSPILEYVAVQFSAWDTINPTTNASNVSMKKQAGGDSVSANGWTNGASPYFEWNAASDNAEGSGIMGYCLYLGSDSSADPITTRGLLGTSPLDTKGACQFAVASANIDLSSDNYIASSLTSSNSSYYLNVKAIDNAGNVFAGASSQFQFRFDNTKPNNPAFITAPSQFVANKDITLIWSTTGSDGPNDANSGLAGLQYKIGNSTWYGESHSGSQDMTDLLTNDGSYTTVDPPDFGNINEGNNILYFRTWDNAGNVSTVYTTTVLKLNTSSPSSPQNVTATPPTNTTNLFEFSWAVPSSFQGSGSNLTYCYTVNTLPTNNTCTFTDTGVTSLSAGAYANQPGDNTFYVVAKDEAGNINYATASSTTFTANTSAPGIPLDLDVADVSTKATSTWRLALSWNPPTNTGAGVSSYRIYRSVNNISFVQVASTSGTSYVDAGLAAVKYYYKVMACDSANNCGAFSQIVNKLPTGRFTSPANMTAQPLVSDISTKKATIRWSTDRGSDSKILLGTKSGTYQPYQIASADQVTDHKVELNNLTPGTTYFAKATWTDEDGNIGMSNEIEFKTEPAPSTQEVITKHIGLSSAQIQFTSVSAAKVTLQYGKNDSFGGTSSIDTSLSKSTYTVELTGLDDGTKYFYRLNTFDSDGNEYEGSTVLTFTTPARPRIANLRFQPVEGEPTSTQKITWDTNVPASSLIRFESKGLSAKEISSSKLVSQHEIVVRDLLDDTQYSLVAESRDAGGNLAVSDKQALKTALDTRPPKINDIAVEPSTRGTGAEARGQIVVSWKTDEPATSQVAYSEGSQVKTFNNKTAEDGTLTTEHVVIVSDIPTSRVYSVQPISKDKSENKVVGKSKAAIIGRAPDGVLAIVLDVLKKVFGF